MIKPVYQHPIDQKTYTKTIDIFGQLISILHPFMPFITEEIWHLIKERAEGDDLIVSKWPVLEVKNQELLNSFPLASSIITEVRNFRQSKGVSPKEQIELSFQTTGSTKSFENFKELIIKLSNLSSLKQVTTKPESTFPFIVQDLEFFIPISDSIDKESEIERLQKELDYTKGFLVSVEKKLGNERFVQNAKPDVLAIEQKKKDDAISKIKAIEEALSSLA
jgi:valyl-tRNA synthetase